MKKLKNYFFISGVLFLLSIPAYSFDNASVCNMIFYNTQVYEFLALREFYKDHPEFLVNFNPTDEIYCTNLRNKFKHFPKYIYSADQISQFYDNCLNLSDQQIGFEYESFLRVTGVIQSCRLY